MASCYLSMAVLESTDRIIRGCKKRNELRKDPLTDKKPLTNTGYGLKSHHATFILFLHNEIIAKPT